MGRVKYITNYIKTHSRRFELKLSKEKDVEIIAHLENQSNVNQYIKQLIVEDMKKGS